VPCCQKYTIHYTLKNTQFFGDFAHWVRGVFFYENNPNVVSVKERKETAKLKIKI